MSPLLLLSVTGSSGSSRPLPRSPPLLSCFLLFFFTLVIVISLLSPLFFFFFHDAVIPNKRAG